MNSLPSLPTRHNGCGSLSAEPNSGEGPTGATGAGIARCVCCTLVARITTMNLRAHFIYSFHHYRRAKKNRFLFTSATWKLAEGDERREQVGVSVTGQLGMEPGHGQRPISTSRKAHSHTFSVTSMKTCDLQDEVQIPHIDFHFILCAN